MRRRRRRSPARWCRRWRSSPRAAAHPLFRVSPGTLLVGAGLPGASFVRSFVTALAAMARRGESGGCRLVSNSMSRDVAMVSTASVSVPSLVIVNSGVASTLGRWGCRSLSSHCPGGLRSRRRWWRSAAPVITGGGPRPCACDEVGGRPATTAHTGAASSTAADILARLDLLTRLLVGRPPVAASACSSAAA